MLQNERMEKQLGNEASPGAVVGGIAARLDRLPSMGWHWKGVLVTWFFWGAIILMDTITLRLYPTVWAPAGTFSEVQYSVLVGVSNGFGPLIGVLVLGPLADKVGRKKVMVACLAIAAVCVPVLGFVSNFWVVFFAVGLTGLGVGGALVTAPSYSVEIVPPASRNRLMLGGQLLGGVILTGFIGSGIGAALLPGNPLAYILTFTAIVVIAIPLVALGIPESPRWLEAHGRLEKADQIVKRVEAKAIAKGHTLSEPSVYPVIESDRVPIRELFRGEYLKRTLVLMFVWLFIYAGINYGWQAFNAVYLVARGLPVTLVLPVLLCGAVGALIAVITGVVLNERIERKTYIFAATIVFAIGSAMYFFGGAALAVIIPATVLTGFGLSGVLTSMYNYTAVAFPTRVRATGITVTDGVGHIAATFGALVAGAFFTATAASNYVGWFLWITVVGALLPGALLFFLGNRQSKAVLEVVSK